MTARPDPTTPLALPFPGDEVMAIDPSTLHRLWTPALPSRVLASADPDADAQPVAGDYDDDDAAEDDGNIYLGNGVAVVCVDGPLMQRGGWWWDGYAAIQQRFRCALTHPGTRAVVLKLNSPGGVAAGCFEAARQLRTEARDVGVPVLVYADEMACSAAYALACVGDEVWLPESGCVGSVGVVATYVDATAAFKDMGLRYVLATSGEFKADGHPAKAITPDVERRLRQPVDHLAALFFAWVAERRGLTPADVRGLEAGVLWGRGAVVAGLADRVGTWPACLARAEGLAAMTQPQLFAALPARIQPRADVPGTEIPTMTEANASPESVSAPVAADAPATVLKTEHDTMVAALTASLDAATAQAAALAAKCDTLAADLSATRTALTEATDKVKAVESARVTAKVEALVGVKLTPAEKGEYLEIALENEPRFDRLMKSRPDLSLTGARIVADAGNETRATDDAAAPIVKLNALADAYQKDHPGTPKHVALSEVMRQRPDLVATS